MRRKTWSELLSLQEGYPSLFVLKPGDRLGVMSSRPLFTDQSSSLVRQLRGLGPDFVERRLYRRLLLLKRRNSILESLQVRRILGNGGRCLRFERVAFGREGCNLVPEFRNRPVQPSNLLPDTLSQFLVSVL